MRLARNIAIIIEIDLAENIKTIKQIILKTFPNIIIISPKKQTLEETNTPRNNQIIWSDGFRLENDRTNLAIIYRNTAGI